MDVTTVDIPKTLEKWNTRMLELLKENEERKEMEREAFFLVKLLSVLYDGDGVDKDKLTKHRDEVGEIVAKNGVVPILQRYMNILTENGKTYPEAGKTESEYFQAIRSIFWNFSDKSFEFCRECEKHDLFDFLANDLKWFKPIFSDNTTNGQRMYEAFSILHNCAKAGIDRTSFTKIEGLVDLVKEYWKDLTDYKLNNDDGPYMICSFFYGAIADEEQLKDFVFKDNEVIEKCIGIIEKAMHSPDRSSDGYSVVEIIYGLKMIARNTENRRKICKNESILTTLQNITNSDHAEDCEAAVQAISILMDALPEEENKPESKMEVDESSLVQSTSKLTLNETANDGDDEKGQETVEMKQESSNQDSKPEEVAEDLKEIVTPGVAKDEDMEEIKTPGVAKDEFMEEIKTPGVAKDKDIKEMVTPEVAQGEDLEEIITPGVAKDAEEAKYVDEDLD